MKNNSLQLQSPWDDVKEKIKEINVEITDEDLFLEYGHEDVLYERLGRKMGMEKENVKGWIESVSGNLGKAS